MENKKQIYDYVYKLITEENKSSEEIIKTLMKQGISGKEASDIYYSIFTHISRGKDIAEYIEEEERLIEEEEIASKTVKRKVENVFVKIWFDLLTLFWIGGAILAFYYGSIDTGIIISIVLTGWLFRFTEYHGYIFAGLNKIITNSLSGKKNKKKIQGVNYIIDKTHEASISSPYGTVKILEQETFGGIQIIKLCTYNSQLGITLERVWLKEKYPGYKIEVIGTALLIINGIETWCDIIHFTLPDGTRESVIFDISQMKKGYEMTIKRNAY